MRHSGMSSTNSTTVRQLESPASETPPAVADRFSTQTDHLDSIDSVVNAFPVDSIEPAKRALPLDSSGPDQRPARATAEQQITLDLLVRLNGDYPATAVLLALLWRSADRTSVRISSRTLSTCTQLGHQVVLRALQRLEQICLVTSKKIPRATAAYQVNVPALRQLLSRPLPEAEFIPGFTPIPALSRLHDVPDAGAGTSTHLT